VTWLVVLIKSWILLSQIIVFIWVFRLGEPVFLDASQPSFIDLFAWIENGGFKKVIAWIILISSIIGFGAVAYAGYRSFLQFLPSSWGSHSEAGGWSSLRDDASGFIAFFFVFFIFKVMQVEYEKSKNRRAQYEKEDAERNKHLK
jgi:TRAP-type C4-dicarboxylate transport system permease small subunit